MEPPTNSYLPFMKDSRILKTYAPPTHNVSFNFGYSNKIIKNKQPTVSSILENTFYNLPTQKFEESFYKKNKEEIGKNGIDYLMNEINMKEEKYDFENKNLVKKQPLHNSYNQGNNMEENLSKFGKDIYSSSNYNNENVHDSLPNQEPFQKRPTTISGSAMNYLPAYPSPSENSDFGLNQVTGSKILYLVFIVY